jgi:hypothetical protein
MYVVRSRSNFTELIQYYCNNNNNYTAKILIFKTVEDLHIHFLDTSSYHNIRPLEELFFICSSIVSNFLFTTMVKIT